MKILIACEESQVVCIAFRERGHEAYSCDIQECSGGHPEWHLQMDIFEAVEKFGPWNMLIGFPPCTFLTVTANKWYKPEFAHRFPTRKQDREEAVIFFMRLADVHIEKIALENPVGIMSTRWRKPDQIIQPYWFGHAETKKTCLWLQGLSLLKPTKMVEPEFKIAAGKRYSPTHYKGVDRRKNHLDMLSPSSDRAKLRSKTYPGIAKAMGRTMGLTAFKPVDTN